MSEYSLAELMICAASDVWQNDGEVVATGIGVIPRLAASLSMKTTNPDLLMTDSESWMLSEPNPMGKRADDFVQKNESWMGFSRIFDNLWGGKRHAMVGPTQIDCFGQANISYIGGTYEQPKIQMLGVRGFPGNSINHANSFCVPDHNKRVFVAGECDMVASIGYNPVRLPKGHKLDDVDIRCIITNLCVLDFNAKDPNNSGKRMRLKSLHPGVSVEDVIENTSFELDISDDVPTTKAPTQQQLKIIAEMDPHNFRSKQLKDNPPGVRI